MGYFISDRPRRASPGSTADAGPVDPERLKSLLGHGTPAQRRHALRQLVEQGAESVLVECLTEGDPETAKLAIDGLSECWHGEKGEVARAEMDRGIAAMATGDLEAAQAIFEQLMADFPDWAEAVNKQATVLYLQGQPEASIRLCRRTVNLKPDHFGAWNGLALCAIQVEAWPLALEAVQESLRLQPGSGYNRQLLTLVESRMPAV